MAKVPTRTSADVNASVDINTLQSQIDLLSGGSSVTKTGNYTILDTDIEGVFYLKGASADSIFTLPTLADNQDKAFLFINLDSDDELQIKGEGAETLEYQGVTQNTIDIENIGCGISFKAESSSWVVTRVVGADLWLVGGVIEMVFTEMFTGTTDADSSTLVTHNQDFDKILEATAHIFNSVTSHYEVQTYQEVALAVNAYRLDFNSTLLNLDNLGTRLQSQLYKLRMVYYI